MTSMLDFQMEMMAIFQLYLPDLGLCLMSNDISFEAITLDVEFPSILETYIQHGMKIQYNSLKQFRESMLKIENYDPLYEQKNMRKKDDIEPSSMSRSKSVQILHQEQSTCGIVRKSPSSRSVRSQIDTHQILFDRSKYPIIPLNPSKQDDIQKMTELIRQTSNNQLPSSIIRPEQTNSIMIGSNPSIQIPEQPPTQKVPQHHVVKQNILQNNVSETFKLIKRSSKQGSKITVHKPYSPSRQPVQIQNLYQEQTIIQKDKKPTNYVPFSNSISRQISSRLEQVKQATDQTFMMRRVISQTKLLQTPPRTLSPQRSQINQNIKFDYPGCRLSQYQSIYNRNSSPRQDQFKQSQHFLVESP